MVVCTSGAFHTAADDGVCTAVTAHRPPLDDGPGTSAGSCTVTEKWPASSVVACSVIVRLPCLNVTVTSWFSAGTPFVSAAAVRNIRKPSTVIGSSHRYDVLAGLLSVSPLRTCQAVNSVGRR